MKTTLAILTCIALPLVPQLVIMFLTRNEEKVEETFEFDYR